MEYNIVAWLWLWNGTMCLENTVNLTGVFPSREYLAIFKKTVAMHEVFLCRVAAHPILRKDLNFHVFLEYNQDVSVGHNLYSEYSES